MQLDRRFSALRSDERGFTMITVMMTLFVLSLLSVAAIAAAQGDIKLSRGDQDGKQAYAAAEAGVNDYLAHLSTDPDYWTRCAGENASKPLATGNAVNQKFTGAAPSGRKWRAVPNTNSRYSIELLPRPAKSGETNPPTSCDVNNPASSMIDDDGNFRIRVTGETGETAATGDNAAVGVKKSIVATFRRTSFLDFVWFTEYENMDPTYFTLRYKDLLTRATDGSGNPTGGPDLKAFVADKCDRHWWGAQSDAGSDAGRQELPKWHGQYWTGSSWYPSNGFDAGTNYDDITGKGVCNEIYFIDADELQGPVHSNDTILTSGSPGFGRLNRNDRVEAPGNRGGTPQYRSPSGTLNTQAPPLDLPPTNTAVKSSADPAYLFTGPTTIALKGDKMDITTNGSTSTNVAWPANGVIYVDNTDTTCAYGYQPDNPAVVNGSCGPVKVSGTYSKDLTIASADDVIITGDITRASGDAVLGLIANNFVRVWHPTCDAGSSVNRIDAGILAVNHSFTADNYDCGSSLGTLTVNGAIAQRHRGVIGTGSGNGTGYIKNYVYDDKLQYRSPPSFLDPVQASWRVLRQNEQAGAR